MSGAPRLLGSRGDGIGEWLLDESRPLLIGRNRQCDVVLEDDAVSRRHLAVQPLAGGGWEAVDLGSSSGTWINEERVTRHRLRSGDRIVVGRTELLAVDIDRPAAEESATPVSAAPPPVPTPPALPPPPPASPPPLPRVASPPPIPARTPQPPPRESTPPRRPPPPGRSSAPGPSRRSGLFTAGALVAALVVVAGGWFGWTLRDRFRSPAPTPVVAATPTPAPLSYSEAAARALLQPSTDGAPRKTPLGSFTTTAAGGKLEHAEVTLEVPAGALPDGRAVTVSRVDAAPVAMRDSFPVTHFGDLTPLSAIFLIETGTETPSRPVVVSFPLAAGARFTSFTVLAWSPTTNAWESFPARLDPASGRAVAELGQLQFVHLLGAEEGGESR